MWLDCAVPPRPGSRPSGSRRSQTRAGMAGGWCVLRCPNLVTKSLSVPADPAVAGGPISDPLTFVRYLDIIVVVLAAPFVVLLGAPVLGYVVGAAAWIIQRVAAITIEHQAERAGDSRRALGLNMASLVIRAWLIGLTILAVGLIAEREDGLAAGITVLVAFTGYFSTSLIIRPLERKSSRP